jgi:hypothetical protein
MFRDVLSFLMARQGLWYCLIPMRVRGNKKRGQRIAQAIALAFVAPFMVGPS